MAEPGSDVLKGTLDLLVLRTLKLGALHGYGIAQRIEALTEDAFHVQAGSLFPALYRLEREGYLVASWGETENRRRAKFYVLTAAGRRKLGIEMKNWSRIAEGIARLLEAT
jgi:PadR family transcriptional regulator